MQILFCFFAKKLIAQYYPSFSTPESPRRDPEHDQPLDARYENDTERQCQMYTANKHENPKIVQRDAGEVRDEVPAKKGPKMKAELRLLCLKLGIGRAHGIQISTFRPNGLVLLSNGLRYILTFTMCHWPSMEKGASLNIPMLVCSDKSIHKAIKLLMTNFNDANSIGDGTLYRARVTQKDSKRYIRIQCPYYGLPRRGRTSKTAVLSQNPAFQVILIT